MISEVWFRQSVTRFMREGIEEGQGIPCFYEDTPEMDEAPGRWLLIRIGNFAPRKASLSGAHMELLPTSSTGSDEGYSVAEVRDAVMGLLDENDLIIPYLDGGMARVGSLIIPDGGVVENERILTGPGDTRFKIITVAMRFAI